MIVNIKSGKPYDLWEDFEPEFEKEVEKFKRQKREKKEFDKLKREAKEIVKKEILESVRKKLTPEELKYVKLKS